MRNHSKQGKHKTFLKQDWIKLNNNWQNRTINRSYKRPY